MSDIYHTERDQKNLGDAKNVSKTFPVYLKPFFEENPFHPAASTLVTYAYDIADFLTFEAQALPHYTVSSLPLEMFQDLTPKDISEYRAWLEERTSQDRHDAESREVKRMAEGNKSALARKRPLEKNVVRRRLASLSSLFTWMRYEGLIDNDPMRDVPRPKMELSGHILTLDSMQTRELLDGILTGSKKVERKHLVEKDPSGSILSDQVVYDVRNLSEVERKTRDRFIARDYAIIALLLGTGVRVSELVGLDLSDVSLSDRHVHVWRKGGRDEEVYFGDETADALKAYLYGMEVPAALYRRHERTDEMIRYIERHTYSPTLLTDVRDLFEDGTDSFAEDVKTLWRVVRMGGRKALRPKQGENALFLSSRGQRISVRMVENIVKDAVLAYVPDCLEAGQISPHKLRATAATRVLKQHGLAYSQQMLGHASSDTTSRFYARLSEVEMQKKAAEGSLTEF